jgi:hypothetical protein
MSRWEAAERHFEEALELNARMEARPWLAHTQHQYAAMLLARGRDEDHSKAMTLLDEALSTAQELGMQFLIQKAEPIKISTYSHSSERITTMPVFMVERNFAEQIEENRQAADEINLINADAGVKWLISFLSVDKKKTFCLYEAPNAEAIREAARRAGLPADVIVEVGEEIIPSGAISTLRADRYALA